MCNDVYNKFLECGCQVLQNTFECHIVRRCAPTDDLLLRGPPVALPARPSRVPPGMLGCERKVATRPVHGSCPRCQKAAAKAESREDKSSSSSSSAAAATAMLATPTRQGAMVSASPGSGSGVSSSMSAPGGTLSPDSGALARVRDSFVRVAEQHRPSPSPSPSPGRYPDREEEGTAKAS